MLGAVATASIISISVFSLWVQQEEMGVLFSNLTPEDASATLQELNKQNIKAELTNGGSTILVPENMVSRLRVDLLPKGVISNSTVTFDIFDHSPMSITEFVQNVNFKRATEGELTRTLEGLDGIQTARVHLVMPKPSLFKKKSAGASASVTLKMVRGRQLSENQISGIQSLISASVENLEPGMVRIHDTSGRELSSMVKDDDLGRSETQLALRKEVEKHLAAKATSMLDRSLGQGKSVVEVNATLNFEKIETELETFDPKVVTRSEERTETVNPQTGETSENSLQNNEIPRTVKHIVGQTGNVEMLMVSVMVDGHYTPSEDGGPPVYTPLNENEIGQLRRIVAAAVGINTVRGDQIEFVNFQFQGTDELNSMPSMSPDWLGIGTQYGGKLVLILLFGIMALALKKNLGNALATAMQPGGFSNSSGANGAGTPEEESFEGIPEIDDQIMDDIQNYASENPERVAEVIQSWINEIDLGPAISAKAGE